ncbi:MAG: HEAT repeat domain-containing protein [Clostridia bacterium]|jgi:HEAT repeat protein
MLTGIAITSIVVCFVLFIILFIWLYAIAEKQEEKNKKSKESHRRIAEMLGAIIDSPTNTSQSDEIYVLSSFIDKDKHERIDILSNILIEGLLTDAEDERGRKALFMVFELLKPQLHYSKMLRKGTANEKAYACKMLSAFYQVNEIPEIRKYIFDKNKELSYNASLAISILGDEDCLVKLIDSYKTNYDYSHRIILELFRIYSGDIRLLAIRCLENSNNYIKASIFKAVAKYKIVEFEIHYLYGAQDRDPNIRVASIKALCEIGNPKYEQTLINAAQDTMWYVRSTAVKGLGKINTVNSRRALLDAVRDNEWWVRYNAAHTLVSMDGGLEMAEKVIGGYDKFAADAVKFALYKTYNI